MSSRQEEILSQLSARDKEKFCREISKAYGIPPEQCLLLLPVAANWLVEKEAKAHSKTPKQRLAQGLIDSIHALNRGGQTLQ